MPATDRQIRVFISSTFRDMQAERNYLVKFIFPELRRLCESRGVVWGEVDLRWGVTDEQAAEGKVLPICLEEIKRCRPYFIGLLGERYGWIPKTIPAEVIEREPWLEEHLHGKKSVTELEIIHGVLRDEAMHGHAYFYFRNPQYIETVPAEQRRNFATEDAECAEKLHRLKDEIRHAHDEQVCVLRDGYRNPKVLGRAIRRDFTRLINKLFPAGSELEPLDRDALDHEAYARSRVVITTDSGSTQGVYIGRQEYFDRLDAHATGGGPRSVVAAAGNGRAEARPSKESDESGALVILGESGSGKSALLANWVARYRAAHPDVLVLQHYIGATPYSADWAAMLRRILGEFKRKLGIQQDIPDKPDALRSAFPNWLHMAAAKGRVVLVLDALNQLEDRDGAPDLLWLPPVLPANVRLVVSTLPGRSLDVIRKRHWPELAVKLLNPSERKQLIAAYLAQSAKHLSPAQLDRIANAPQAANPLYLRVLLDELRLFGRHEELDQRIGHYLKAKTPYDLYGKVIVRWETDYEGDSDLVGDTLSLLWAARRGLSEAELLGALGTGGQPLPRAVWSPLFLAMADALSRGGLLTFAHDFLRMAAREAYVPNESAQQQSHLRLADFFERQPTSPRRTDELPWQLAEAKAWPRLQALLTDRAFFTAAWKQNQFEVKACWTQIEGDSPLRMVEAYRELIDRPETEPDKNHVLWLSLLLADTGHPEEALRLRLALVRYFRDSGALNKLQAALVNQAVILQACGDLDGALALLKEAEQICQQLGDPDILPGTLLNQANILYVRWELSGALALLKEAERISRQLANVEGLAVSLANQAVILAVRGDLDGAMTLHKEVERICRQLADVDGLAASLSNQALILRVREDLDGAMRLHKEAERISRQLGDLYQLQSTLGNQALILRARGDLDGALALLKEAVRICRQLGHVKGLQRTLGSQALILIDRGDLDGAMTLLKEVERICRQLGYLSELQRTLGNQAVILADRGDLDGALALLKEQERIYRQLGDVEGLVNSLDNQAGILADRGDLDGALALHEEKERICRQLGNVNGLAYSLANQASVLQQRGRAREGLPLVEEAHRLATTHGYAALARQIEPILNAVRQAAQGGKG